jgi:tetratricopeptide (TPR) repeat protein
VRINAQLIDAKTGGHLWAERYDGQIGDIFALQDEITQKIVSALAVKLTVCEEDQVASKETDNVAAYDAFLQGQEHYFRRTPDDFATAVRYFEKAIALDPDYGRAHAALALTYWESQHNFWRQIVGGSWFEARVIAETYLQTAMKNPTTLAYQVASKILVDRHEHEEAIAKAQSAIALDPNDTGSYLAMAYALIHIGTEEEAFDFLEKAMRLDPHYSANYLYILGLAHFGMAQFEEAAACFERALKRNPVNYMPLIPLAAAYAHLDRQHEAAAAIAELKEALAGVTVLVLSHPVFFPYKDPADKDRILDGLRMAGMTESLYDTLR